MFTIDIYSEAIESTTIPGQQRFHPSSSATMRQQTFGPILLASLSLLWRLYMQQ